MSQRSLLCVVWSLMLPLLAVSCVQDTTEPRDKAVDIVRLDYQHQLLQIAEEYQSYGRLDPVARWGPKLCSFESTVPQASLSFSSSSDSDTHGRKLYSLYVKLRNQDPKQACSYIRIGEPNPVGQVVVKESWVPERMENGGEEAAIFRTRRVRRAGKVVEENDIFVPYARKNGHLYRAGEKVGLFIMCKLDPQTLGTDTGWVYGTVAADGKTVLSGGLVESCMGCHQNAPHDRLFGLQERD